MSIYTDFDASYGEYYTGIPSVDGTVDIVHSGAVIGQISQNTSGIIDGDVIFQSTNVNGGVDTFTNGVMTSQTQPNIYGGEDTYSGSELSHQTVPNEHGGFDIYSRDFHHDGTTFENVYGSEDYLSTESNANEIMSYNDPLRYAQELKFAPFNVAQA